MPIRAGVTPAQTVGAVNPDLVKELQDLLERAKAGELHGLAYAALYAGDLTVYDSAGRLTRGVIGAIELLKFRMCRDDLEDKI